MSLWKASEGGIEGGVNRRAFTTLRPEEDVAGVGTPLPSPPLEVGAEEGAPGRLACGGVGLTGGLTAAALPPQPNWELKPPP